MARKNVKPEKLYQVLAGTAPDKVSKIVSRYQTVMDGIADALVSPNQDLAMQAREQIDGLTNDLIEISEVKIPDMELIKKREELIEDLDRELDLTSASLGIVLEHEPEALLEQRNRLAAERISKKLEELSKAKADFQTLEKLYFDMFGGAPSFEIPAAYIKAYTDLPSDFRVPFDHIYRKYKELFDHVKPILTSGESKYYVEGSHRLVRLMQREMDLNINELYKVAAFYCNGNQEAGDKLIDKIISRIDDTSNFEDFRRKAKLPLLQPEAVEKLLLVLADKGINQKQALEYLKEIRDLSPEDFDRLHLDPENLIDFLVLSILNHKEGGKEGTEIARRFLQVEAAISSRRKEFEQKASMSESAASYAESMLKRITDGKGDEKHYGEKESPNEQGGKVHFEIQLALENTKMVDAQRGFALVEAQRELLMSYLTEEVDDEMKVRVDLASDETTKAIKDILNCNTSNELISTAGKYNVDTPSSIAMLGSLEVQHSAAKLFEEERKSFVSKEGNQYLRMGGIYSRFVETGDIHESEKADLLEHEYNQSQEITKLLKSHEEKLFREREFYTSLKSQYKDINAAPQYDQIRLGGYMRLLQQVYVLQGKNLGVYSAARLMGAEKIGPVDVKKEYAKLKKDAEKTRTELTEVASYLGVDKENLQAFAPDVESASLTPLHYGFMRKETAPYIKQLEGIVKPAADNLGKLAGIYKRFENFKNNPETFEKMGYPGVLSIFEMGIRDFDNLLRSINLANVRVRRMEDDLKALLSNEESIKDHPQYALLKPFRKKILEGAIAKLESLRTNEASPICDANLQRIKALNIKFHEAYDDAVIDKWCEIGTIIVIISAAVAAGIGLASLASRAGTWLFGYSTTIGETTVFVPGLFSPFSPIITPLSSKVLVSGMTMTGMALGGTGGSRFAMLLTDAVGWSKFGLKNILDPKKFGQDFGYSFLFCLAAVGGARGIVGGLKRLSVTQSMPRVAGVSRAMLDKLGTVSRLASPFEWFGGANEAIAMKLFKARFGIELGQEMMESGAGAVNPVLEFILSVCNATDGVNVELNLAGIDGGKTGITVEKGQLAYKTDSPEAFVENINEFFAGRPNADYETMVNTDDSVTISILYKTKRGKPKTGATINVRPAEYGLTPQVEIARVARASNVENMEVTSARSLVSLMDGLENRGFVVEQVGNKLKATKMTAESGVYSEEFTIDPELLAELKTGMDNLRTLSEELSNLYDRALALAKPDESLIRRIALKANVYAISLAALGLSPTMVGCGVVKTGGEVIEKTSEALVLLLKYGVGLGLPVVLTLPSGIYSINGFIKIRRHRKAKKGLEKKARDLVDKLTTLQPPVAAGGSIDKRARARVESASSQGSILYTNLASATVANIGDDGLSLLDALEENEIYAEPLRKQVNALVRMGNRIAQIAEGNDFSEATQHEFDQLIKIFNGTANQLTQRKFTITSSKLTIATTIFMGGVLFAILFYIDKIRDWLLGTSSGAGAPPGVQAIGGGGGAQGSVPVGRPDAPVPTDTSGGGTGEVPGGAFTPEEILRRAKEQAAKEAAEKAAAKKAAAEKAEEDKRRKEAAKRRAAEDAKAAERADALKKIRRNLGR